MFKVGDKVRRVKDEHCGMKVGDVGTIEAITMSGHGFILVEPEFNQSHRGGTSDTVTHFDEMFMPVIDTNRFKAFMPVIDTNRFKAGDRVRLNTHSRMAGMQGTVQEYTDGGLVHVILDDGQEWKTDEYRYDLIEEDVPFIGLSGDPLTFNPDNAVTREVAVMPRNISDKFRVGDRVIRVNKDNTSKFPIGTKAIVVGYALPALKVMPLVTDLEGVPTAELRAWYPEHTEHADFSVDLVTTAIVNG